MSSSLLQRLKHRLRSEANTSSTAPAAPARRNVAVKRLVAEPWYVDRIDISGDCLSAAGWSMPIDLEDKPADGWFTVNGRPFDELRYPLPRPDVGEVFWMREGAGQSGFEGSIGNMTDPYPGGVLEIRRVNPRTPAIEIGRDSWFKPDPARHMDLPDAERRFRVIGDRDPNGFLISGATDYHRIDRVVAQMSGRHLHEFARVLDWGVGCGRLARHFPRSHAGALTGCDIDRDNVAWCGSHLAGRFVDCNMWPPLPFEAASFELIYSVSVFTHLREPMQMKWLEELERVMRPGALLLTTVHGQTAIDFSRSAPAEYQRLSDEVRARGIVFSGQNTQLDGHADHGGEYVNVYHDADYVRRIWGRFFEIERILPGYIIHHDLVVLRKR
jgi:SAM-dependent methyltransferase